MAGLADSAIEFLRTRASGDVIVGLSGGKDSLVCLALACKAFPGRVRAFSMYLVKNLRCFETSVVAAEVRHEVTSLRVPHWGLSTYFREAQAKRDDTEFYLVVVFKDREAQTKFCVDLGLDPNSKYVDGERLRSKVASDEAAVAKEALRGPVQIGPGAGDR